MPSSLESLFGSLGKQSLGELKGKHLSTREKLFILFGETEGWSTQTMATRLNRAKQTITNYRQLIRQRPREMFRLPVCQEGTRSGYFKCAFCGMQRKGEEVAKIHVAGHVLAEHYLVGQQL